MEWKNDTHLSLRRTTKEQGEVVTEVITQSKLTKDNALGYCSKKIQSDICPSNSRVPHEGVCVFKSLRILLYTM